MNKRVTVLWITCGYVPGGCPALLASRWSRTSAHDMARCRHADCHEGARRQSGWTNRRASSSCTPSCASATPVRSGMDLQRQLQGILWLTQPGLWLEVFCMEEATCSVLAFEEASVWRSDGVPIEDSPPRRQRGIQAVWQQHACRYRGHSPASRDVARSTRCLGACPDRSKPSAGVL